MPRENGGMALKTTAWILIPHRSHRPGDRRTLICFREAFALTTLERTVATVADDNASRTVEQQTLVDFASDRFDSQNLELPEIKIQFHDSLETCGLHQGLYVERTKSLHMCSVDKKIMLHEMAHAWANLNMTSERQQAFVEWLGLKTWNGHDEAWEDRATEHAAETIAWGLMDEPTHVRWTEGDADVKVEVSYRLLSIGTDVETLVDNFVLLTGRTPVFRSAAEWPAEVGTSFSPEATAMGR